jgi:hypothetical protein
MGAIDVQAIISDMARAAWSFSAKVAHHGACQDHAAAGRQALQEAQQHELARFGCKGAADAGQDVGHQSAQDDRPAAEAVAGRAIKDLAGAEGDHKGRQGELDVACRAAQIEAITGKAGRYISWRAAKGQSANSKEKRRQVGRVVGPSAGSIADML